MKAAREATGESFRASVSRFVAEELRPLAARWEAAGKFPRAVLSQCARRGYFQPQGDEAIILAEELPACESLGLALSVFVQAHLVAPLIQELGSEEQKRDCGRPLVAGEIFGCVAVSESVAGSDFGALQCEARAAGGRWVLNGSKTYITNAALADFAITAVRIAGRDREALSLLLVPLDRPGVRVKPLRTLGLATSGMGTIEFRDCRIPQGSLLGEADQGFAYVQRALNRERLLGGIAAVGWAQYAVQRTIQFVRERQAFGQSIGRFQAVRHQLAEATARLEAARQFNYATYARWLKNEEVTREICMLKLFSYQMAQDAITTCLQLHGGLGYLEGHWTSRFYRDARALTIAAGTPEVMKEMIAAYLRI